MRNISILYLLAIILSCTACVFETEETSFDEELKEDLEKKEEPTPSNQGVLLTDGDSSTYHFLAIQSFKMGAEEANAFKDSLIAVYEQKPEQIEIQFVLGSEYATAAAFHQGADCEKAVELLSKVIEQDSSYRSGAALFNRAQAYFCQGDAIAATADLQAYKALDLNPNDYVLLDLAKASFLLDKKAESCQYFQRYKQATEGSWDSSLQIWEKRCSE